MLEKYRKFTIETKTDIYTGYVDVSWWRTNGDKGDLVNKGAFRSVERAAEWARKEVDWFHKQMEMLGEEIE